MAGLKTPMASWDTTRQQAYQRSQGLLTVHLSLLLDASGSMASYAPLVRETIDEYLRWLQTCVTAGSSLSLTTFATRPTPYPPQSLYAAAQSLSLNYQPSGGTALYDALGQVLVESNQAVLAREGLALTHQPLLLVITDGEDRSSREYQAEDITPLMQSVHTAGWLCIFLGTYPQARVEGLRLGFHAGNCLVCGADQWPEAFQALKRSLGRYLTAPAATRKLLNTGGIF